MGASRTFVLVGASLARAKAADTLRSEGFEGKVVLIGEEPVRPYERPPLSKQKLRSVEDGHELVVHDEGYYKDHDIERRLSTPMSSEMEHAGYAHDWDHVVFRGDPSSRKFMAFFLRQSLLAVDMHVDTWGVRDILAARVAVKRPLGPVSLADPDVDLAPRAGALNHENQTISDQEVPVTRTHSS